MVLPWELTTVELSSCCPHQVNNLLPLMANAFVSVGKKAKQNP
jgi:hypothetical protein